MNGRHRLVTVIAAALLATGCGQDADAPSTPPADGRPAGSSGTQAAPTGSGGTPPTAGSAGSAEVVDGTPAPSDGPAETAPAQDQQASPPGPEIEAGAVPDAGAVADTSTGPGEPAGFSSSVSEIDGPLATRMNSSWRPGCPVPLSDLRYLTVTHRGFDGTDRTGELVVASAVTADVATIFGELYAAGYPIESMRLVDDFGGSDDASMAANNTSAFNCRQVTGGAGFSEHSYGTAIDLNPVQNPYLSGGLVLPEQGRRHLDRAAGPGVIQPGDSTVAAFAASGWSWGGTWSGPVDYQHFSVSGR
jgi:hypothetical protein